MTREFATMLLAEHYADGLEDDLRVIIDAGNPSVVSEVDFDHVMRGVFGISDVNDDKDNPDIEGKVSVSDFANAPVSSELMYLHPRTLRCLRVFIGGEEERARYQYAFKRARRFVIRACDWLEKFQAEARDAIWFEGVVYTLNQSETGDLFEWYEKSEIGEYTRFYQRVVLHTAEGLIGAYADNLNDYVKL